MALRFLYRSAGPANRIAIFPGAYNPPTVAHVEIARAATRWADEVIWVLPRAFPHKTYGDVSFDDRVRMLLEILPVRPGFSLASSDGGLYAEIADEAREYFGDLPEIGLVCGRDAAERIAGWDYGEPAFFERMVQRYPLLVAARQGGYTPDTRLAEHIRPLALENACDQVSSSAIRALIAAGADWEHLVPPQIRELVRSIYGPGQNKVG